MHREVHVRFLGGIRPTRLKDYLVGRGSFLKVTPKPLSTCLMQLVVKVVK
jgi:hypothetical protein